MKQIRIGNQTSFSASTPILPFEYAIENGFDAFEWFPDKKEWGAGWDEKDINAETRRYIKNKAIDNDIALSVHAPWYCNPLKQENHVLLLKDIEFAQDIGATLLNIHLYTDDGIEDYVKAIIPIIRSSAEAGLNLSIENTPITTPENFNRMFDLLQNVKDKPIQNVGMCFDLGHANLCSSTRNDYLRFIYLLESQLPIIHVHMHENFGDRDSHLPVFTGPSRENDAGVREFVKRLRHLNFSGSIILEQWPDPPSLLNQARERLQYIWDTTPDTNHHPDSRFGTKQFKPSREKEQESVPSSKRENRNVIHKPPSTSGGRPVQIDTEGPGERGDDFINTIVEADKRYPSWREKLSWIASLFKDEAFIPDTDQLIYLSIYLRFLGTGELACSEDGRHFRPSHHANTAQQINEYLTDITTPENAFIVRKIYPWLPSYDIAFTRSEPLTRIRDIAHRNDIPKELKKEIKHTLQNKLHRCAGPEDLATSAAILERITVPDADYSTSFVEEFKIFHSELKEFFNAHSLEERLESIIKKEDTDTAGLTRSFLAAKDKGLNELENHLTTLELLTKLRSHILAKTKNDTSAATQQFILADIGLEDFLFVLLSQTINKITNIVEERMPWSLILEILYLTVINLRLSGIEPEECNAIESEINAWKRSFEPDRLQLLRLKATLERSRRLCEEYADKVLKLFHVRVENLGRRLGVKGHAIRVFCEGDIRGNIVFQLSKLISLLLKNIRKFANLPPFDAIVSGNVEGRLISVDCLDDLTSQVEEDVILLLKKAEGDEVIPKGVNGIILYHQLPHLSHLGVRARQDGVVFVSCEDGESFRKLEYFTGERINLNITAEKVNWEISSTRKNGKNEVKEKKLIHLPRVHVNHELRLLTMDQVNVANSGAKAEAARRLEELSSFQGSGFKTPLGLVIPFGVMEESLRSTPTLESKFNNLVNGFEMLPLSDFMEALKQLRMLIGQIKVHDEILSSIRAKFTNNVRLMVRSSSNCEDNKEMAGAGLYDSFANVSPVNADTAIRNVWASLWTKNATMSRRYCGIPHNNAYMAVLIQQMLIPDLSFIIHTVNPISLNPDEIYVELAAGLGETLAAGAVRGVPYRMICSKKTGDVQLLTFANFSYAIWPDETGGVGYKRMDYSRIALSTNPENRHKFGKRIAAIGQFVENAFGYPQDIEGAIVGDDIYLVQSRSQQSNINFHGINRTNDLR
jgi:phosphoglucan,water dikinase